MIKPSKKDQKPQKDKAGANEYLNQNQIEITQSIINASIDSLVALDTDLRVISWNETAALWYGKPAHEVIGQLFFELFPSAHKVSGFADGLQHALAGRKYFLPVTQGFHLQGFYETHFVPLTNSSGEIWGALQIMHDVAHRIKAEDELKSLNSQLSIQYTDLQHANEELANFSKIASHDLKEPLRKIYTFVEFIMVKESEKLSPNGRSYFRSIQKSAQRMGLLTDDIANFSELSTNNGPLERVDLSALLSEVTLSFKNQIDHLSATIEVVPLPDLTGYASALKQMLSQIISNALKFRREIVNPELKIHCEKVWGTEISHKEVRPEQQYYCICFRDNGIGFKPEYDSRIFDLFQKLHADGKYRGSGMGLAIALKAARMHGGFIKATSIPGVGSSFYCYLPVVNPHHSNSVL